ncbi:hypothetical protein D3C71_988560 [compost metagenome]
MRDTAEEIFRQRHVTGRRQPLHPVGKEKNGDRRRDEFRQRHAGIGDQAHYHVGDLAAADGSDDAERNGEHQHQADREEGQNEGASQRLEHRRADRLAGAQ